jgi:hypothetical protein
MPEITPRMAEAVVAFLHNAWPAQIEAGLKMQGWNHMFSTSYQIACRALVALGEAEATDWGAVPIPRPKLPEVLPFWEDIAVAVLWLAQQQNLIGYRQLEGSVPPPRAGGFVVTRIGAPPPAPPNIGAGPGSMPAQAAPAVVAVLEALGLVAGGYWTAGAEVVLWRGRPGAKGRRNFEADARFQAAVEAAVTALPPARQEEIELQMRVSLKEVEDGVSRSVTAVNEARAKWGDMAWIGRPMTAEQLCKMIPLQRTDKLDWIFHRHWRLGRGWLDETQTARALEIFNDQLAIAMRSAVVARLYPDGFVWE